MGDGSGRRAIIFHKSAVEGHMYTPYLSTLSVHLKAFWPPFETPGVFNPVLIAHLKGIGPEPFFKKMF